MLINILSEINIKGLSVIQNAYKTTPLMMDNNNIIPRRSLQIIIIPTACCYIH